MKKHGRHEREDLIECCEVNRNSRVRISERDDSVKEEGLFQTPSLRELPQEGKDVQSNDQDIDNREILGANRISQRNHLASPVVPPGRKGAPLNDTTSPL